MKPAILFAGLLAAGVTLQAQMPSSQAKVDTTGGGLVIAMPDVAPCPVSLRALQGSGGQLVATRNGRTTPQIGQRIHLLAANPSSGKKIAGATVTAKGLSPRGRFRPAEGQASGASDIQRTMDVTFAAEDEHTMAADLRLAGFTVVDSIRLDSISYSDGSTWNMTDHSACSVSPDGFMLVAGK